MQEDVKKLMEKLSQVLGEVIQESEEVRQLLRQLEESGYASNLTLAIVLGLNDQPTEIQKIIYEPGRQTQQSKIHVRRLSAFDRRFLKALRIKTQD